MVVGRDLEGTGEILKEAKAPTATTAQQLVEIVKGLVLHPELIDSIEESTLRYAAQYSWWSQAHKHFTLADWLARDYVRPVHSDALENWLPEVLDGFGFNTTEKSNVDPISTHHLAAHTSSDNKTHITEYIHSSMPIVDTSGSPDELEEGDASSDHSLTDIQKN